jgi:hypothetical protein
MSRLKLLGLVLVVVTCLGLMWYETFAVTGVTAPVVPPGVERPTPPPAPRLSALPLDQADIDLFGRLHPTWSAF